jgi:hypothetical protein
MSNSIQSEAGRTDSDEIVVNHSINVMLKGKGWDTSNDPMYPLLPVLRQGKETAADPVGNAKLN